MTYELEVYQYNKQTQTLEHTNTITDTNNEHANKELASMFIKQNVRGTYTKTTYTYNAKGTLDIHITQEFVGSKSPTGYGDFGTVCRYEYTFHDCTL